VRAYVDFSMFTDDVCVDGFVGAGEAVDVPFADVYFLLAGVDDVHLRLEVLSHGLYFFEDR